MVSKKRPTKKLRATASSSKTRSKESSKKTKRKVTAKAKTRLSKKPAKKSARKATTKSKSAPGGAMRLTFAYQGNQVKLVSQEPVDMVVPPSDSVEGYSGQKGFWAELKGRKDKTLFRRVLHNPTRNDAEVFPDDGEHSISRVPAPNRKGVFVVVVPRTEEGNEVALSRSTPQLSQPIAGMRSARLRSLAPAPAKEFARFKLKK